MCALVQCGGFVRRRKQRLC